MNNKPVNNEIALIRKIFVNSLNEESLKDKASSVQAQLYPNYESRPTEDKLEISNAVGWQRSPRPSKGEKIGDVFLGAGLGAAYGAALGGPPGAVVGGLAGGIAGVASGKEPFDIRQGHFVPHGGDAPHALPNKAQAASYGTPQTANTISSAAAKRLENMGFKPSQMPATEPSQMPATEPSQMPATEPSQLDRELGGRTPTDRLKDMQKRWDAEKMDDLSKRVDAASKRVDDLGKELTTPWNISTPSAAPSAKPTPSAAPSAKPTPSAAPSAKPTEKKIQDSMLKTINGIVNQNKPSLPIPDAVDPRYPGRTSATPRAAAPRQPIAPSSTRERGVYVGGEGVPAPAPRKSEYSGPYSQRAPEVAAKTKSPQRQPVMITKMNKSGEYENVAADLSNDEDLRRIQPGSASYGQLTDTERKRRDALKENYYNILSRKLDEAIGIEQSAYGFTPEGGRKVTRLANRYEQEPMVSWSGDSATVEDLPAEPSSDMHATDAEAFVKGHVINLMRKAQEDGIKMTHGQAHKIAMERLRQHLGQAD